MIEQRMAPSAADIFQDRIRSLRDKQVKKIAAANSSYNEVWPNDLLYVSYIPRDSTRTRICGGKGIQENQILQKKSRKVYSF